MADATPSLPGTSPGAPDIAEILKNLPPVTPLPSTISAAGLAKATAAVNDASSARQDLMQAQVIASQTSQKQYRDLSAQAEQMQEVINGRSATQKWEETQAIQQNSAILGVDHNHPESYMLDKLAAVQHDATANWAQEMQKLTEMQSVKFTDDPVQWIMNQYSMQDQAERVNGLASQVNGAETASKQLAASANSNKIAIENFSSDITQTDIANALRIKNVEAQIALSKMDAESYAKGATEISLLNQVPEQQLHNYALTLSAQVESQRLVLAQQEEKRRKEEFDIRNAVDAESLKSINRGLDIMFAGHAPVTMQDMKVLRMLPAGSAKSELMNKAFVNGEATRAIEAQTGKATNYRPIDADPGKAAAFVTKYNVVGSNDQMRSPNGGILPILKDAYIQASQTSLSKKPDDIAAATSANLKIQAQNWAGNAETAGSPIKVDSLQRTLAGDGNTLKNTLFYHRILDPQVKAGLDTITPTQLLDKVIEAGQSKQVPPEMGLQFMAAFYKKGVLQRQVENNMTGLGFDPITQYKVRVDGVGSFGGSGILDLSNPVDLRRWYISKVNGTVSPFSSTFKTPLK